MTRKFSATPMRSPRGQFQQRPQNPSGARGTPQNGQGGRPGFSSGATTQNGFLGIQNLNPSYVIMGIAALAFILWMTRTKPAAASANSSPVANAANTSPSK